MSRLFKNINFDYKVHKFDQIDWINLNGIMDNSVGGCYGLSSFWLITGGGNEFLKFVKSKCAKEEVQTLQKAQRDMSLIQAKLTAAGQRVVRNGQLYYYPLEEMLMEIAAPGHYLIGLKNNGTGAGHAIACSNIIKAARVFDPNWGQISCDDKDNMPKIVRALMAKYTEYNTAMWIKSLN